MEKKELEIMAPAGGFDCLHAAIQGGADAVYFGIGRLNMRSRSAGNFQPEDLPEVVRICREAGVRSYLTLNITLYQEDLAPMREALDAVVLPTKIFTMPSMILYRSSCSPPASEAKSERSAD